MPKTAALKALKCMGWQTRAVPAGARVTQMLLPRQYKRGWTAVTAGLDGQGGTVGQTVWPKCQRWKGPITVPWAVPYFDPEAFPAQRPRAPLYSKDAHAYSEVTE